MEPYIFLLEGSSSMPGKQIAPVFAPCPEQVVSQTLGRVLQQGCEPLHCGGQVAEAIWASKSLAAHEERGLGSTQLLDPFGPSWLVMCCALPFQ